MYPRIYLAVDNCFAGKRWTRPEEWCGLIAQLGMNYVETSADTELDPLYMGAEYLSDWLPVMEKAAATAGIRVANLYSKPGRIPRPLGRIFELPKDGGVETRQYNRTKGPQFPCERRYPALQGGESHFTEDLGHHQGKFRRPDTGVLRGIKSSAGKLSRGLCLGSDRAFALAGAGAAPEEIIAEMGRTPHLLCGRKRRRLLCLAF